MVAQARAAPLLEAPHVEAAYAIEPRPRQEHVIDVIGRAVLPAVAPIERRHCLLALLLARTAVIGADEPVALEDRDRDPVVDPVTGFMPDDVVVEIAGDDRGAVGEKALVLFQPAPQRSRLSLPHIAA